jgi:hypothetical protein
MTVEEITSINFGVIDLLILIQTLLAEGID